MEVWYPGGAAFGGWNVCGVQSAWGCPLVGQLKPVEVVDVGATAGDGARG